MGGRFSTAPSHPYVIKPGPLAPPRVLPLTFSQSPSPSLTIVTYTFIIICTSSSRSAAIIASVYLLPSASATS